MAPQPLTPSGRFTFLAPPPVRSAAAVRPPTFAVVVPAYQAAGTIGEALRSLFEQTRPPDEIVICDDGSTDALLEALEPFRERVQLVRQDNRGPGSARNAAARAARSDFVVGLDADDLYAPERIEAISELALLRPDLDLITTDAVAEVHGTVIGRESDRKEFPVGADEQRRAILRESFLTCPAIRRERLLEIGGFDETLRQGEDWDCWIRLILGGSLVGYVGEPLYRYRLRSSSLAADPLTNVRANVVVLRRALTQDSLTAGERESVIREIDAQARTADLLALKRAIVDRRAEARRLALRVATRPGFPAASRAKAALAILVPGIARRLMVRHGRDPETGSTLAAR